MSLRLVLRWLTSIIVVLAVLSTTYLYVYPFWFGCAFPSTTTTRYHGFGQTLARHAGYTPAPNDTTVAPFRLLVLADPQLEGDSSLPDPEDALFARLQTHSQRLRETPLSDLTETLVDLLKELLTEDIPRSLQATRKTLDLFGNDYYLAHIYRTLHWWTFPTHVTVLGDLIGSQWVSDEEFEWRAWRYWNRVFSHSHMPTDEIMNSHQTVKDSYKVVHKLANEDPEGWKNTIINAVGNHDIGYAGDISTSRIDRFEKAFGKVNWDIHFSYPDELLPNNTNASMTVPTIHLVILNSMLLDTPALDSTLQSQTYEYLNDLIVHRLDPVESRNSTFTLLLTHVPLHKPEGTCVDAPFFDFWDFSDADGAFNSGGLKEQNHLSEHTSHSGILQAIFGMSGNHDAAAGGRGRNGLILTGHDHEGCDVVHYIERNRVRHEPEKAVVDHSATESDGQEPDEATSTSSQPSDLEPFSDSPIESWITSWSWKSIRTTSFPPSPPLQPSKDTPPNPEIVTSLREITLRSMMGSFSGNAGLLSLWYDFESQEWRYEMQMCPLGVQHVWWAVHVVDLVALLSLLGWCVLFIVGLVRGDTAGRGAMKEEGVTGQNQRDGAADRMGRGERKDRLSTILDGEEDYGRASSTSSSTSIARSGSQRRRKG